MGYVAVIGGGIIGASVAWRLAQKQAAVTLFERGELGCEASSAGAGMLAPGGEIEVAGDASALLLESLRLYPRYVKELREISGFPIDYRQCGAIDVAETGEELETLKLRARSQYLAGISSRPAEVPGTPGGIYYPDDALVDSPAVMGALRCACIAEGVEIREQQPIERICLSAMPFGAVVLAAGAWSGSIDAPGLQLPRSFPVKGHLLGYDLPAGSLGPILRHGHTYVLQRSNGFTIAGSSSEDAGFDKSVDQSIAMAIDGRARKLVPSLPAPSRIWTGLRPGADEIHIGRYEDTKLWLAYGHYRNGILAAPATAERLATAIIASLEKD